MSVTAGILSWLGGPEKHRKRASRLSAPGLKGCYWDGGTSSGHPVRDISATGAYIVSQDRLYVGTILTITLQTRISRMKPGDPRTRLL